MALNVSLKAQVFPNPATLSTGQGTPGTSDPIWTVSGWFSTNPPNPSGLSYSPALINNNCAPGSWVSPSSLPPPVNNGNWITGSGSNCGTNTNDGYLYFRLTLNLPADCNGNSVAAQGNYVLYLSGYADNTITDVFVNGTSTGISGGSYSSPLNITLNGPWLAGTNYVDVQVYNFPNGGNSNPYGLLLVANSVASNNQDSDGDGVTDINDQCPCAAGNLANGCVSVVVTGDSVICNGESTTLTGTGAGSYLWNNGATTPSITVNPTVNTRYSLVVTASNGYTDSSVINVRVNQLPAVTASPAAPAICTGNSATLTASGAASYAWSTTATTTSITVSPTNNASYSVTGTDANGCSASATSNVTVNALPVIGVAPSATAICNGNSASLTASGGTGYSWSTTATTAVISVSPSAATTYVVTGTDANNCSATASGLVNVNALPVPSITPANPSICVGNSITLTAAGGTGFVWGGAETTAAITVSPSTTTGYSVTVTDANSCTASATTSVAVNQLPVPAINPAAVAICADTSATLTASGGNSYLWNTNASGAAISVSPPANATYTVTATDANSCSATASAQVTVNALPIASITPASDVICMGNSSTLTASGGTAYGWSTNESTAAIIVTPTANTTYTVTVTDVNTCSATATANVTVVPTMVLATAVTNISCNGNNDGAISLNVSSGQSPYNYAWSTNATTANISGLAAGTYSVIVTDNAGCTATTQASLTEPALLVLTSSYVNPTCKTVSDNGSITINVTGGTTPYQYNWSTGASTAGLVGVGEGNFDLTVSDAKNCTVSSAFVLAYIYDFAANTTANVSIKAGETATLDVMVIGNAGNFSILWNPAATLSCADCANPVAAPNLTTVYNVEIKNDSGCSAIAQTTVTVVPDYTVFVPNAFSPNNDGNNDVFKMFGNIKNIAFLEVQIFNRIGEKVFESEDHEFAWDGNYKGVIQAPGIFTWQMKLTFLDGHKEELRKGSLTLLK